MNNNESTHEIDIPIWKKEGLSVPETAKLFNICPQTIRNWIKKRNDWSWYYANGSRGVIWRERFKEWIFQFHSSDEIA